MRSEDAMAAVTDIGGGWGAGMMMCFLHHYACMEPYRGPGNKQHRDECVAKLIDLGLLVRDESDGIHATAKGKAFAQMVLTTPLPEKRWLDPREARA
jgi:hypothetical protein